MEHPGGQGFQCCRAGAACGQVDREWFQPALRDFLRPVDRDLGEAVRQCGIGETREQLRGIGVDVEAGIAAEAEARFVAHEPFDQGAQGGIGDRLMHEVMALRETEIGERGVGAIEHPQLGGFMLTHIGYQLRAADFPARARSGKAILDHPLAEGFGDDGGGVLHADGVGDLLAVGIGDGGHDAIDHGGGARAFAAEPGGEAGIDAIEIGVEQARQDRAIFREIIAADQRQARDAGRASTRQPGGEEAVDAAGGCALDQFRFELGQIKLASRCAAIALFRHGEADDVRAAAGQRRDDGGGIARRDDHALHCADQAGMRAAAAAFRHSEQAVLRFHLIRDIARSQRYAGDAPIAVARRHGIVGIDRLMRAVKSADAEMDDAAGLGRAVIAQPFDVGVQRGDGLLR